MTDNNQRPELSASMTPLPNTRHRSSNRIGGRPALWPRSGYTLVEMLVAVALVLLLMTLFAQVFQVAGSSISTQRGLMENDQRARSVQTLLKGDLDKRTFRYVLPFTVNEELTHPSAELSKRRGYFYISENNIGNDLDDVLAMTVDSSITTINTDETEYAGQALALAPSSLTAAQQLAFFRFQTNQPDHDDGRLDPNGLGLSPAAEVAYFVRGGNLYRRVLLVRQPSSDSLSEPQPSFTTGTTTEEYFRLNPAPSTGAYPGSYSGAQNFWRDFDYSAHSSQVVDDPMTPTAFLFDGAIFNTTDALNMSAVRLELGLNNALPVELAYPPNRFGHNFVDRDPQLPPVNNPPTPPEGGQPKEFLTRGASAFVGRFTQRETSDGNFVYPHQNHLNSNCPVSQDLSYPEDTDGDGYLDPGEDGTNGGVANGVLDLVIASNTSINFSDGGLRGGEDLLLANVHAFDIKVYDEILNRFVDLGHTDSNGSINGDYHINRQKNSLYGPRNAGNRIFDTWYPYFVEDIDNDGTLDAGEDLNANSVIDRQVLDLNDDGSIALANPVAGFFTTGEIFPPFRPQAFIPATGSGTTATNFERWRANTGPTDPTWYGLGSRIFPELTPQSQQFGDPLYYVCIRARDTSMPLDGISHGVTPPSWPRTPGATVDDGELTWQAVDNRKPLKAIQITVRFVDPTTAQMRTLTIQHGLVD